jgi:RNA polymerase sigma-70 factor (ECF subfamily)
MSSVPTVDRVTEAWREHRPYLVDLAFRMLGDIGEAEDVVQEAFSRLLRSDIAQIEDARGWLIVVTSRLCLDQVRSARWRRQRPQDLAERDARLPATGAGFGDPADRVTLDESVQLALLVVLERLTPAERVVFVLHDLFQLPFDTVAETVGRSAPTCRQLARRARQKVQSAEGPGRYLVMGREHRRLTEKFVAACATGDLAGLLDVLDPQVSGEVDLLPSRVLSGADRVARNLLVYVGPGATLVSCPAPQPVLLSFQDRKLTAVLALTITKDRITAIHAIADPAKLDVLGGYLGAG